jgi:peptidoglycan/xylan/chitin deacetylase (PgdA/CDA1 family)
VSQRAFEAQMRGLARAGRLVSLDDVVAFAAGRRTLAPDAVLVTIDDGYRSVLDEAAPVLREYAVPAVFFVCAGLIGSGVGPDAPEPFLGWDELARVRDAGIEIGSHAFDHVSLGRLPLDAAREQAVRSRALLEERLGGPVRAFAYPFGTRADFSPATDRVLAEAGYAHTFSALHGAIRPGMPPGSLPRVKVEGGESQRMFELTCRGAMDGWRLVDELLWRLQQVRAETRAVR